MTTETAPLDPKRTYSENHACVWCGCCGLSEADIMAGDGWDEWCSCEPNGAKWGHLPMMQSSHVFRDKVVSMKSVGEHCVRCGTPAVVNVTNYVLVERHRVLPPGVVYIGRGGGRTGFGRSPHANPYRIGEMDRYGHMLDRSAVIYMFGGYMFGKLALDPDWLLPLVGMVLACHCPPLDCHGHLIRREIAKRYA